MRIWVGCSGWSYKEWEGVFYPPSSKNKLQFYSNTFNTVEIDSSFYHIPNKDVVLKWLKMVSGKKFLFSMKVPEIISHDLFFKDFKRCSEEFDAFLSGTVSYFSNEGKLGSVLLQMPPYFRKEHKETLYKLLEDKSDYRLSVEVRNAGLYHDKEMKKILENMNICFVDTDSFESPLVSIDSGLKFAYVRLHGRNSGGWRAENPFDYKYKESELSDVEQLIKRTNYEDIFVYFNNHPRGNAPLNAIDLNARLGFSKGRLF
ncbi:MAG: DUF72 domain-containing protein [Thermoplasmata archaeon]